MARTNEVAGARRRSRIGSDATTIATTAATVVSDLSERPSSTHIAATLSSTATPSTTGSRSARNRVTPRR